MWHSPALRGLLATLVAASALQVCDKCGAGDLPRSSEACTSTTQHLHATWLLLHSCVGVGVTSTAVSDRHSIM